MYLKFSKRIRDKGDAERLFRRIIQEYDILKQYTLNSIIHLLELLLYELKTYGEIEVLEEIKNYLFQMHEIANEQYLFPKIVDIFLIRSKLQIIEDIINLIF